MIIDDAPPELVLLEPSGIPVGPSAPIVIAFSESMQASSLAGAFEIVQIAGGVPGIGLPLVGQLVAEDRVFVALPPMELAPSDYQVRAAGIPLDVTGQALEVEIGDPDSPPGQGLGEVLFNFSVTDQPEEDPQLIAVYPGSIKDSPPAELTEGVSETGELVFVFDREMNPDTFDTDSVVVDNGGMPVTNLLIRPLTAGPPGIGAEDTRVFLAQHSGFSPNGNVGVTLSPSTGNRLVEASPGTAFLPATQYVFRTGLLEMPLGGIVLSDPSDAIGTSNLVEGGINEFMMRVLLQGAMVGDIVDVYLFGLNTADPPRRIAVRGTFEIPEDTPDPDSVTLGIAAFPIETSAGVQRFADGELDIALRHRRGILPSSVRVFDVDPSSPLVEEPILLDTEGPTLVELLPPGGSTLLVQSDARNVVILGQASENVRAVEVVADGLSNELVPGVPPPVVGAVSARFVAAPVPLGVVDGGSTTFTLIAYDAALNPSDPITGTFQQKGLVRAGTTGGDALDIEVFDSESFAPLQGAMVYVHSDLGDGSSFPLEDQGFTGPGGGVVLNFDPAAADTLVTVDLAGYDLFTLHGLAQTGLSVPLRRSSSTPAMATGNITSTDSDVSVLVPMDQSAVSDTRFLFSGDRAVSTNSCVNEFVLGCDFGPSPIRPFAFGAQSFFAGDFFEDAGDLDSVEEFLTVFDLRIPTDRVDGGSTITSQITLERLLSAGPADEAAMAFPEAVFDASMTSGVDLMDLAGDPLGDDGDDRTPLPARPRVTVETEIPGLVGPLAVSTGAQLDLGGGMWEVRPVYPGIFERPGFLGSLDPAAERLRVRFELRDTVGNASGRRPLASSLPGVFDLPDVTQLAAPSAPVALPFQIELTNTIPDPLVGIYSVELDDGSRKWTLWRVDTPGSDNVVLRVPELDSPPLASGVLGLEITSFQAPGATLSSFLFSDLLNLHDRFTRTARQEITLQP